MNWIIEHWALTLLAVVILGLAFYFVDKRDERDHYLDDYEF